MGYAKKVLSTLIKRCSGAITSLTKAIYNRKAKVVFALISAMVLTHAAPVVGTQALNLLGLNGTSRAAGSLLSLMSGLAVSFVEPLCTAVTNPVFLMGASFVIGTVMFLKHFPEVDHYIHHSFWSEGSDDDVEDLRKLSHRMGWSKEVTEKLMRHVSDAKDTMMKDDPQSLNTPIERAAAFASLLLAGGSASLVLLTIFNFALLPMALMSLVHSLGCGIELVDGVLVDRFAPVLSELLEKSGSSIAVSRC